jgi:hypothetical protein
MHIKETKMDHIVYLDTKAQELEKLLVGQKSMIVRGATGRKLPYGRVQPGDTLYFVRNNGEGTVQASATVNEIFNSEKLSEVESKHVLNENQSKLDLTHEQIKRWGGKRYLVLVEVMEVCPVEPFAFDRSGFGNMDDWLPVEKIENSHKSGKEIYNEQRNLVNDWVGVCGWFAGVRDQRRFCRLDEVIAASFPRSLRYSGQHFSVHLLRPE